MLSVEQEMPFLHHCLNTMPHEIPVDEILADAIYLMKLIPPLLLKGLCSSAPYDKIIVRTLFGGISTQCFFVTGENQGSFEVAEVCTPFSSYGGR